MHENPAMSQIFFEADPRFDTSLRKLKNLFSEGSPFEILERGNKSVKPQFLVNLNGYTLKNGK